MGPDFACECCSPLLTCASSSSAVCCFRFFSFIVHAGADDSCEQGFVEGYIVQKPLGVTGLSCWGWCLAPLFPRSIRTFAGVADLLDEEESGGWRVASESEV